MKRIEEHLQAIKVAYWPASYRASTEDQCAQHAKQQAQNIGVKLLKGAAEEKGVMRSHVILFHQPHPFLCETSPPWITMGRKVRSD